MVGVGQLGGDAVHVVIVQEGQQMPSLVQGPLLGAELPGQGVADLKHVHGVEGGPQPFVALVVGDRVAHVVGHPAVVVPVEGFAHQYKVRLEGVGEGAQLLEVLRRQAVGHAQPQAVDAEAVHPGADGVELVLDHRRVEQVQLDQLVVALPALVPEAVVVLGVAVEADVEPVLVGAVPLFLPHILEGPETPAHVVEDSVQHHPDTGVVEGLADLGQVVVGAQAGVRVEVVPGVVAVAVAVEYRVEQNGVRSGLFDMVHPVQQTQDAGLSAAVVVRRRAAQAQGVDLINDCLVKPHNDLSFRPEGRVVVWYIILRLPGFRNR